VILLSSLNVADTLKRAGYDLPSNSPYSVDWTNTVKGDVDYHALSAQWDSKFRAGQRGTMTFRIKRSAAQKALAHIPLHSWFSDITGPLTVNECKGQIVSKLRSEGLQFWRDATQDGDTVTVYFVTGLGPAAVALVVIGIFGIGLLVNWTIDTVTVSRIKQDYAQEAIEAGQQITDPKERAEFYATQAEATKSESLFGFGFGDDISGGMKTAVIIVGIAAAAVVVIWGVSRS